MKKLNDFTAQRIQEVLRYAPETGIFTWIRDVANNVKAGSLAGYVGKTGYRVIRIGKRNYKAHRLAWLYFYGVWPDDDIDHKDGDRDNNRIANLRDVVRQVNSQNQRSPAKKNGTGKLGVSLTGSRKNPYRAAIWVSGKLLHLGVYESAELAHGAYLTAKRDLHAGCTL